MEPETPTTVVPLQYAGADVYNERHPGWRRRFTLTDDRLLIHAKRFLGNESEIPISLRSVDPIYAKIWKRSEVAGAGSLIFSAMLFALVGFALFGAPTPAPPKGYIGPAIIGALAVLCLITGLRHIRKLEFASFGHNGGPRFDIARSGPDRDKFNAFVGRIVGRIQELRSTSTPPSASAPVEPHPASTGPATDGAHSSTPE